VETDLERARALVKSRDFDAAGRLYAEILAADPRRAEAWLMQGVVAAESGRLDEARAHMARAFEIEPRQAPGSHVVYANVLLEAGDLAAARAQSQLALEAASGWPPDTLARLRRQLAQAHWRHARSLHQAARVFEAIDAYHGALALDDDDPDLWNELANACADAGMLDEAQRGYRETLALKPDYHQVESNLLISLHYDPAFGPDAIYEAHRAWARRHADALKPASPPPRRARPRAERLRVGFISPAFHRSASGIFALPLLENLDPDRFEIACYRVAGGDDAITARIRRRSPIWHDLAGADDAAIAARIRADALDVLVDLAGHTPGGRLLVLARKPAPVIATWLDYFDTTGLETVDYLIGDSVSIPAGGTQRFSEEVLRIDPCRLCYAPPDYAPAVAEAPCAKTGHLTFGSFNRLPKLAPPVIALWSRALAAVPGSRLVLKNAALVDARTRERLLGLFESHGVERARIELRAASPHPQMLAEYGDVDIALDPFPYNGGLTTCEALWMGVPVLALLGGSMISRQSASLLAAGGLGDWVATSEEDLLRKAVKWSRDRDALRSLRADIRERLLSSPLLDAAGFSLRFGESLSEIGNEDVGAR